MKWTPILIDWDTSDRTQMDYTQDSTKPVSISTNSEAVSTSEANSDISAEIVSGDELIMFGKLISSAHKECMEIGTDLKLVPEYSNLAHYLAYEYKVSTPGNHCYCNRCIGFLEMAHFNVIKTRNILYRKLVVLAKNNSTYRERYSALYYRLTGFSVKFSDMSLDLPIIDNSCYDYQRPSPLVLGICHFRRRYEQLEACHVKIVQTKNAIRQQVDSMIVMNEDLLDKCDLLFAIMQEKLSANSKIFEKHYEFDPEDCCPCRHNCSDCSEMMESQLEKAYDERFKFFSECETMMEEYTELEAKYEALVHRVTNSSRFEVSSRSFSVRQQYECYEHLRSQQDRHIVEQYRVVEPSLVHSDPPRDRCGSCSYCELELKLINAAKVNRIFRKIFKFEQQYSDLFEEYANFRNRVMGDW
ncbi:hypothetical protein BOTCAL_0073g00230 [Botryotinia calthae]|uniref:Uncharacterized protein n=1 Tax=Botryotinia calthae TaxID=38488 RepID=A0A4Y8D8U8_9HELO|nr:hypothetical protein BOTCAL_0073g00230 [Botryotinia calthae]